MKSLLRSIFLHNWPRKALSLFLAMVIWLVVNQSLTTTKTLSNIAVRITNIPPGKTVEGIQANGVLAKRISLTLTGSKSLLDELSSSDFEVVIDASNQRGEWIASISKKNLVPLVPEITLSQSISKVSQKNVIIKLTKLVTEKVPIIITQPIGEPPKGYQFVDVWPYQLYITVSGPESVVKKLKTRGLKLTFNLSDISKSQLDDLRVDASKGDKDVVSFYVPNHWKQVSLPSLSQAPIEINDPNARLLRIDFLRNELVPIKSPIQLDLFFPLGNSASLNPLKMQLVSKNKTFETKNGLKILSRPLFAKGVSELFLEIMKDMMEIVIIASPRNEEIGLDSSLQFINHRTLEDKYVASLISDMSDDELSDLQPRIREEYLRNRFRNFMNRCQLFVSPDKPLKLQILQQGNTISVGDSSDEP